MVDSTLSQASLEPNAVTTFTITLKTINPHPSGSVVLMTWSDYVELDSQSTECTVETTKSYPKSVCTYDYINRQILITGVFNQASSPGFNGDIIITLTDVTNPLDNQFSTRRLDTNGFIVRTFTDSTMVYRIDRVDDNVLLPQLECSFPCYTCLADNTAWCTSCYLDGAYPFLMETSTTSTC